MENYREQYPSVVQYVDTIENVLGDYYGKFYCDPVITLTDGSKWKIHSDSLKTLKKWQIGDEVHVAARFGRFWLGRQHAFFLCNHDLNSRIKAMLVKHKAFPLTIIDEHNYAPSPKVRFPKKIASGRQQYQPHDLRKILFVSDGSAWIIKDKIQEFQKGMQVYIGAQGISERFYDFILITGDEKEAVWTMARPQK